MEDNDNEDEEVGGHDRVKDDMDDIVDREGDVGNVDACTVVDVIERVENENDVDKNDEDEVDVIENEEDEVVVVEVVEDEVGIVEPAEDGFDDLKVLEFGQEKGNNDVQPCLDEL